MKHLFSISLILLFFSGVAQTSNKKKVLVIPYGRFEFVSDFSIEELAEKNSLASTDVFNAYQKAMLSSFGDFQTENFEFIPATDELLQPYKKYIKYVDGKFKGKNHYALKMKGFPEKEFTQLLEKSGANFIIFINWYQIKKESFISKGKKREKHPYSGHYIDYEIYNLFQQKIIGVGKQRVEVGNPTEEEVVFKMLRLTEIKSGYQQFIASIAEVLDNPISKK